MVNARSIEAYRFVFDMARPRVHLYHSRFFDTTIYDARISRKEFNIEKKKKILETFRIFTRNFAPDFLERAKLSRRRWGRKGRDTRLDSSRSSARRSNNSDWNPRNRGSIERFSIKGRNKVSFYRWWWSSRVAPPRHGITLLHINESGPSAHKIRTNER